ncbi:MAG: hypothetical protein U1F77_12350 [Kiritimatiellia bacterium]
MTLADTASPARSATPSPGTVLGPDRHRRGRATRPTRGRNRSDRLSRPLCRQPRQRRRLAWLRYQVLDAILFEVDCNDRDPQPWQPMAPILARAGPALLSIAIHEQAASAPGRRQPGLRTRRPPTRSTRW